MTTLVVWYCRQEILHPHSQQLCLNPAIIWPFHQCVWWGSNTPFCFYSFCFQDHNWAGKFPCSVKAIKHIVVVSSFNAPVVILKLGRLTSPIPRLWSNWSWTSQFQPQADNWQLPLLCCDSSKTVATNSCNSWSGVMSSLAFSFATVLEKEVVDSYQESSWAQRQLLVASTLCLTLAVRVFQVACRLPPHTASQNYR